MVVSQASIVSVLQGAGHGGGTFLIAIFLAFILTVCYISTYSELSLMLPKAGSISTYTAVSIGHFAAIIATLAAYVAPAIFAGPAELLLLQHILDIYSPDSFTHIALLLLWIFTILNILGIDLFASIQGVITSTMLVTLFVIGFEGLRSSGSNGVSSTRMVQDLINSDSSVFSLVLVALWPFIAFEMICGLIEEAKNPRKHIPRAMFYASFVMLIAYSLLAYTAIKLVPADQLANSDIPHWALGNALLGNTGKLMVVVLSITTTCGMISSTLAAIPRMLYGMAHHKQIPAIFMRLHPKWKTPWFSILFLSTLVTISLLIFGNNPDALLMLLISAASCWLLSYIIAHINVIVLRKKHPGHSRPYKSPLFPLLQIIGIAGMLYVLVNNAPTPQLRSKVYFNAAIFIGVAALYALLWVKFKMKKGLFEAESMTKAIKD